MSKRIPGCAIHHCSSRHLKEATGVSRTDLEYTDVFLENLYSCAFFFSYRVSLNTFSRHVIEMRRESPFKYHNGPPGTMLFFHRCTTRVGVVPEKNVIVQAKRNGVSGTVSNCEKCGGIYTMTELIECNQNHSLKYRNCQNASLFQG